MTNDELAKAITFSSQVVCGMVYHFQSDTLRKSDDAVPADVRAQFFAHLSRLLNVQAQRAEAK